MDAIELAYTSAGSVVLEMLKALSTGGVSTSWALAKGVSIGEICSAAIWSSPATFAAYYHQDVAPSALARSVLGVAVSAMV